MIRQALIHSARKPTAALHIPTMGILDLPLEVLDHIIDFTLPHGIESFALSCKTIYTRAGPQIQRHNALRRQWQNTTNASPNRLGDTLRILKDISRDPLIAEYIESLSLWDQRRPNQLSNEPDLDNFRADTSAMAAIKDMLAVADNLAFQGFTADKWWTKLVEEDELNDDEHTDKLYAIIALLGLLPNLKTLQLPDRWHEVQTDQDSEDLVPAVQSLVALSTRAGSRLRNLGNLKTLLPFVEEGYDVRVGLQCLQPFMVLPSIREIYAVSCVAVDDNYSGIPFHWSTPGVTSPLTKVEFASCCMDADGISALLVNTPALTVFKYSHQTKWHGCEHDWNPGAFVETIANHCGNRLTELAITIDQLHGEIINGMSSFLRFPVLKKIEVDVLPFCGPPLESGQSLGMNSIMPDGATPWTHDDIPCLGDMLPESIEELQVNITFPEPDHRALLSLFKNIKIRRISKLRALETVIVRQYRFSTARQFAEDHGIVLEVFDEDAVEPRPRSMMPAWKREFDQRVGGIVFTS